MKYRTVTFYGPQKEGGKLLFATLEAWDKEIPILRTGYDKSLKVGHIHYGNWIEAESHPLIDLVLEKQT